MKTLRDIGENQLLRELLPHLPQRPDTLVGPGDDCAVVRIPGSKDDWLFTTDPVIENRHFLPATPPRQVGRKAIARGVSDIAAMGGTPRWILINLVAPADTPLSRIRSLYTGMNAAAKSWGIGILGGDTAEGSALELHITVVGSLPHGSAILRSGAKTGHKVYVTGALGGAYLPGCRHHLLFEPRLEAGRFLAAHTFASAMMDLSDGLATDLPRLLEASGRGVCLEADAIPLSRAARKTKTPLAHALSDGEDFELLFTVPPRLEARFDRAWKKRFPSLPATCIGTILAQPAKRILRQADGTCIPLRADGYQHFLSKKTAK